MEASTQEIEIVSPEKPTQLAPRAAGALAVKTPRAMMLAQALEEEREQRSLLKRYVDEFMVVGEDYGVIPGTSKKDKDGKEQGRRGLLKPGAEKLMDLFRCRPEYEVMAKEVSHETGLYYYEIKCRAVSRETDTVLNEGVGSASSYESKYRYRNAGRVCPHCGKDAIIKGKAEYGGGWVCFNKKGGCGAKWDDGAAEIEGQEVGKVQNPDLADVANTVLKMAKKRAQVDCAIALARVSDMFTQDIEDFAEGGDAEGSPRHSPKPQPHKQATQPARPAAAAKPTTPPYVAALWQRVKDEYGATAQAEFQAASKHVFGDAQKPSNEWTQEECAAVEKRLFDVPF